MIPKEHRAKAGWAALAVAVVGGFEGMRTVAYRDPVGIPTVCFGETRGVHMGDKYTPEQCKDMLGDRLEEFDKGVAACVDVSRMSAYRHAAVVSFAYNVGVGTFCHSQFAKRLNDGDVNACDELKKYVYARGVYLPGLARRRQEEAQLCRS